MWGGILSFAFVSNGPLRESSVWLKGNLRRCTCDVRKARRGVISGQCCRLRTHRGSNIEPTNGRVMYASETGATQLPLKPPDGLTVGIFSSKAVWHLMGQVSRETKSRKQKLGIAPVWFHVIGVCWSCYQSCYQLSMALRRQTLGEEIFGK